MARTTGIAELCSTLTIRKIVSTLTEEVILMEVAEHRITSLFGWSPGITHLWKVQRRQNGKRRSGRFSERQHKRTAGRGHGWHQPKTRLSTRLQTKRTTRDMMEHL